MTRHTLSSMADTVQRRGPDRVVINSAGSATTSEHARVRYGITPDIVFLRGDGWTLGAPEDFERVAYAMWRDEWVGFMRRTAKQATPIVEYQRA